MIFKLKPAFKDYLWGGNRLKTDFGKDYSGEILAESWELSCHPDGESIIASGQNKGEKLSAYLNNNKDELGKNCDKFKDFPILVKFIDAKQSLSVQVHPNDDFANINEADNGKTEMWYIVDAKEDAFIYYGFNKTITKPEFAKRIENNTLLESLNKVDVKKGDCFFIKSGTVHAIGEGCLIAEIQQSSNVTYRVYDYARKDANGNLRELHIDKALQVSKLCEAQNTANNKNNLVTCEYFTVDLIENTNENKQFCTQNSFNCLLVLNGNGNIKTDIENINFKKGESVFIGAQTKNYNLNGNFTALLAKIE